MASHLKRLGLACLEKKGIGFRLICLGLKGLRKADM